MNSNFKLFEGENNPSDIYDAKKFAEYKKKYDELVELCKTHRYTEVNGKLKKNKANKKAAQAIYDAWKKEVKLNNDPIAAYFVLQYHYLKTHNLAGTVSNLGSFPYNNNYDFYNLIYRANNINPSAIIFANLGATAPTWNKLNWNYSSYFIAYLLADDDLLREDMIEKLQEPASPFLLFNDNEDWDELLKHFKKLKSEVLKEFMAAIQLSGEVAQKINEKMATYIKRRKEEFEASRIQNNNDNSKVTTSNVGIFASSSRSSLSSEKSTSSSSLDIDDDKSQIQTQLKTLRLICKNTQDQEKLLHKQVNDYKKRIKELEALLDNKSEKKFVG